MMTLSGFSGSVYLLEQIMTKVHVKRALDLTFQGVLQGIFFHPTFTYFKTNTGTLTLISLLAQHESLSHTLVCACRNRLI